MSHPLWVCGLKYQDMENPHVWYQVTPFMGVWIEIFITDWDYEQYLSHPLWVCGLKYFSYPPYARSVYVTPFMGVWIEIVHGEPENS